MSTRHDPTPWGLFDIDAPLDEHGEEQLLAGPFADQAEAVAAAARFRRSPETQNQHRMVIRRFNVPRDQRPVRVPHRISVVKDGNQRPWHGQIVMTIDGVPFPYVIKDLKLTEYGDMPAVQLTLIADTVHWDVTAPHPVNPDPAPQEGADEQQQR